MVRGMNDSGTSGAVFANWLIIAAVIGVIPAAIAHRKGHSFGKWWLFGVALFILALPLSITLKPSRIGERQCPSCAEWISAEAKVCKHCGRDAHQPPAGWYPNPNPGGEGMRWWDGSAWGEVSAKRPGQQADL